MFTGSIHLLYNGKAYNNYCMVYLDYKIELILDSSSDLLYNEIRGAAISTQTSGWDYSDWT